MTVIIELPGALLPGLKFSAGHKYLRREPGHLTLGARRLSGFFGMPQAQQFQVFGVDRQSVFDSLVLGLNDSVPVNNEWRRKQLPKFLIFLDHISSKLPGALK